MPFTEKIKNQLKRIRQFRLQEDRAILLMCLGISLIFWILVKLSQEYTSQKPVLFSYEVPDQLALVNIPPTDVYTSFRGTGWNLMFEHLANADIPIDLQINKVGTFNLTRAELRNEISNAFSSKELTVAEVNYDEITLKVEEKTEKKVPIRLRLNLAFAAEHHPSSPLLVHPDSIILIGAVSVLNEFSDWPTDSLNLTNLTKTTTVDVPLRQPPPEMKLNKKSIEVTIPVEAYTEKSLFVPVSLKNAPSDSLKVFPDKIKVNFVIGLSRYDSVHYTDFELIADLKATSLEKGKNTVPVNLTRVPPAVKNVVLSRESVEFFILKPDENNTEKTQ